MIFVTMGNAPHPFNRLAGKADEIAGRHPEEFLVQCGHTVFPFRHVRAVKFLGHSEMRRYMKETSVLVSHGGCGTLSEAIKLGKRIVAVPRLEGEHNHSQRELVEALEKEGCLLAVYNINDLEKQIRAAQSFVPKPCQTGNAARIINDFIKVNFLGQ